MVETFASVRLPSVSASPSFQREQLEETVERTVEEPRKRSIHVLKMQIHDAASLFTNLYAQLKFLTICRGSSTQLCQAVLDSQFTVWILRA